MTRTRWEIVVVLLLSYGMSALYAVVGIVDRLTRPSREAQAHSDLLERLEKQM